MPHDILAEPVMLLANPPPDYFLRLLLGNVPPPQKVQNLELALMASRGHLEAMSQ